MSGVLLFLVLRNIELAQVQRALQSVSKIPLLLGVCVAASSTLGRAVRWGVLLGYAPLAGLRFVYTSMMIGYLANNVLPARMGELIRLYVLERQVGVSKSTSAAAAVLERLTDVLLLLALIDCIAFFVPLPTVVQGGIWMATVVCVARGYVYYNYYSRSYLPVVCRSAVVGIDEDPQSIGRKGLKEKNRTELAVSRVLIRLRGKEGRLEPSSSQWTVTWSHDVGVIQRRRATCSTF